MNVPDEIRKTLSDPKPLYALAGAGDLAAEKLKDAPERLRDAPTLLAEAGATLTSLANKLAAEGPERLAKVGSGVQDAAGRGRPDAQALRGLAQTVAIQQVGRLLEAAGKAVETYDELAERGRVVVSRYTGTGAGGEGGFAGEADGSEQGPVTVLVEQVTDEEDLDGWAEAETVEAFDAEPQEHEAKPAAGSAAEAAQVFEEAAVAEAEVEAETAADKAAASKLAAKKAAPRKRAAAPKGPRKPKD